MAIWGKHDRSFEFSEPEAYRRDVPKAEVAAQRSPDIMPVLCGVTPSQERVGQPP